MNSQEALSSERQLKLSEGLWEKNNNNFTSKVFGGIYLDEKTADIHFICGAERIPAHKCILSKSSPYFDAMFYGPNANECDKDFSQWSPEAFREFLKLCYLDEVVISPNNIIEVMKLAHQSLMFESLQLCGELWADNMTIDDVCCAYHWAIHFGLDEFKKFCEQKISVHTKVVLESSDFLSCDVVVLDHILGLDSLSCDEATLLQASLNWASKAYEKDDLNSSETKCLQNFLKDSLYKIRYSSLTPREFCEILDANGNIFTDPKDLVEVFRLTTGAKESKNARFNLKLRSSQIAWIKSQAITYNFFNRSDLMNKTIKHGSTLNMTLRSSRPILLGGFYWAPLQILHEFPKVTVRITQESTPPKDIHVADIKLESTCETDLDLSNHPILLRPEFEYKIHFKFDLNGSDSDALHYFSSKMNGDIKLGNDTIIDTGARAYNIIRGFKFNLL